MPSKGDESSIKKEIKISLDEFQKYLNIQKFVFQGREIQPSILSIERQKKSGLPAYIYAYIYDHYDELMDQFKT